ncbi:MAG: DNA internalization-related competence protein ComEC/Rec2 [Wenzhouxiangellaceae bacterium]
MPAGGALAFSAGVLVAALAPSVPAPAWLIVASVSAMLLLAFPATRLAAAFGLGCVWFLWHAHLVAADQWPAQRSGEQVELLARVAGVPVQRDGRARLILQTDREARAQGVPRRIQAEWYRPREWFRPGEVWRFRIELSPPRGRVNPGLFDYERYLYAQRIGALGKVVEAQRVAPGDWRGATDRLRQRFGDLLQAGIAELPAAALAQALTVGNRSAIDAELGDRLRRTGTAHLLAISGLHVGLVATAAGLLAAIVLTLVGPWLGLADRKRAALVVAMAAAAGYALLAGLTLPTRRALVMLAAALGAIWLRRRIRPSRALLAALLVVLLIDPLAPLDGGFWFSFGAVAILLWSLYGRVGRRWRSGELLRAQGVLALGLLPLNLWAFGQWAPTGLLANLIAIPLVGFWVLPLLLAALAAFVTGLPHDGLLQLAGHGLTGLDSALQMLAGLDDRLDRLARPALPAPGLWPLVLGLIGAVWLLAPRGWPLRLLGVVLLLPLLWPVRESLRPGEFDLLLPDLGSGSAAIVMTAEDALLYGTGTGDGAERNQIASVLQPLLRRYGHVSPAVVIVPARRRTWSGGAAAAQALWPDARFLHSGAGLPGAACDHDWHWRSAGVEFAVLHPSPALPQLGDDSACVLELRSAAGAVLLAGPVSRVVQRRLVIEGRARAVDAVLLPRGGHHAAFDADWFSHLDPDFALASIDAMDGPQRPDPVVLGALARSGVPLYATGRCGAILVRFRHGRAPEVHALRREAARLWRFAEGCPIAD